VVKTHVSVRRAIFIFATGVSSRSRHFGPGHVVRSHCAAIGAARCAVWCSSLIYSRSVCNPVEIEAVVVFSHVRRGNHPALWASSCHGFIRFSGWGPRCC